MPGSVQYQWYRRVYAERARLADDPDHHGLTSCEGVAVVVVIEAWKPTTGEEHEALDFVVGPALVEDEEAARASQGVGKLSKSAHVFCYIMHAHGCVSQS